MKKIFTLLASVLVGSFTYAQVELTPFLGYMMNGKVNGYYGNLDIKNDLNYGGSLAFDLDNGTFVELLFNSSEANATLQSSIDGYHMGKIRMNHYQIGVLKEVVTGSNVVPFGVYGLGASSYHSDSQYNAEEWEFSVNLGLGVKIWLTDMIGIRLSGRMYLPLTNGSIGVGIGAGTGGVSAGAGAYFWVPIVHCDLSGGLIFRLGSY